MSTEVTLLYPGSQDRHRSTMENENKATVYPDSTGGTVVTMTGVDLFKTGTTTDHGRFYTSSDLGGKYVEYVVKEGGHVYSDTDEPAEVEIFDPDVFDSKRVLDNGHLHTGESFENREITVCLRVVEPPQEPIESAERATVKG